MWFQQAVVYAIDVGRFADGDGDGLGDFRGLTAKLGYLHELGVTCLWLLPFYPTPNRDNGYDIEDYYGPDPRVGTREDFVEFVHKAGEFGIRVIVDLVVNHTSDQHPWFQAARRDARSRFRDYYVWTDMPPALAPSQGNVFPGAEHSVWCYDEVARAYYFHKFYHFEPSLNTDNREVREEIVRILDYWLAFGVSGFRVDAAPFIVSEKGHRGREAERPENLLREMREYVRSRREDCLLLGEVNVPVEQIGNYFGDGDKLNALFDFYFNTHLYLALAREEAAPVHAALRKLPRPPHEAAWATFLRNLDELDLSRLSKEEQEEVLEAFAPEEPMRIFGRGIRRRLPPMLGGDRRRVEMAMSLLFASPGAPVLVYGEEIGMGDNLELAGRDAVRSPMQWSAARNAGFSEAPAEKLVRPVLEKGPFSYKKVNVAAQLDDPGSLLRRVRELIRLRRQHPAIGAKACRAMDAGDPRVLVLSYEEGEGRLIAAHNLGKDGAPCRLELGPGEHEVLDLLSEQKLPAARTLEFELPAYGYRWMRTRPRS